MEEEKGNVKVKARREDGYLRACLLGHTAGPDDAEVVCWRVTTVTRCSARFSLLLFFTPFRAL